MTYTRRQFVYGTLLSILSAGCATTNSSKQPYTLETKALTVRAGNIHPVTHISREEGEGQLMNLASESRLEESWIFFDVDGKGKWVDTGAEQTAYGTWNDQLLAYEVFKMERQQQRTKKNIEFTSYHIHTIKSVCKQKGLDEKLLESYGHEALTQSLLEVLSIPSPEDVAVTADFNDSFRKIFPKSKMRSDKPKVVMATGIFTIDFTEDFKAKYIDNQKDLSLLIGLMTPAYTEGFTRADVFTTLEMLSKEGLKISYERRRSLEDSISLDKCEDGFFTYIKEYIESFK